MKWDRKSISGNVKAALVALRGQKFKKCTGQLCQITKKGKKTIRENCVMGVLGDVLNQRHEGFLKIRLQPGSVPGTFIVSYSGGAGMLPKKAEKAYGLKDQSTLIAMNDGNAYGYGKKSFKQIAKFIEANFKLALAGKANELFDTKALSK